MKLIILTEGQQTEVLYFNALIQHLGCAGVQIQPGKSSDPIRLLREAIQMAREQACDIWVVLDAEITGRDRVRDRRLKKALIDGERFGIRFALSEPCFEAWLLAHINGVANDGRSYADQLTRKLGQPYKKSDFNTALFLSETRLQNALNSQAGKHGLSDLLRKLIS
jgi:hypothetical protein